MPLLLLCYDPWDREAYTLWLKLELGALGFPPLHSRFPLNSQRLILNISNYDRSNNK